MVRLLEAQAIARTNTLGAKSRVPLLGFGPAVEVKRLAAGFSLLYDWLNEHDTLVVKTDRPEPLVVPCMSLAVEIAKAGTNPGLK
jgi:hypothetical protein